MSNSVREYARTEKAVLGRSAYNQSGCNHVRKFEEDYLKPIEWKPFPKCSHNVEGYCKQCLADTKPEPEYWSKAPAPAKHDIRKEDIYLVYSKEDYISIQAKLDGKEVYYSLGCTTCYKELYATVSRSLRKYSQAKGFYISELDIEESVQLALEYTLKKPDRWQETLDKALEHGIPAKGAFCRLARSKLKNLIRSYVMREKFSALDTIAPDKSLDTKLSKEINDFTLIEQAMHLKETLTQRECNLIARRLEGYSLKEIATMQAVSYQAIQQQEKRIFKALNDIEEQLQ